MKSGYRNGCSTQVPPHLRPPQPHSGSFLLAACLLICFLVMAVLPGCSLASPVPASGNGGSNASEATQSETSARPSIGPAATTESANTSAGETSASTDTKRMTDGKPLKTAIREVWALDARVCVYWFDSIKPGTLSPENVKITVNGNPVGITDVMLDKYGMTATIDERTWHGQHVLVTLNAEVETEANGMADAVQEVEARPSIATPHPGTPSHTSGRSCKTARGFNPSAALRWQQTNPFLSRTQRQEGCITWTAPEPSHTPGYVNHQKVSLC